MPFIISVSNKLTDAIYIFVYLGNGDVSIRNVGKAIRKYNLK